MRISWLLWLACEICCGLLSATDFHVSTAGTAGGDGSTTAPWNLVTALSNTAVVKPGDTVLIQADNYVPTVTTNSRLQSTIAGTSSSYVTIQGVGG